MDTAKILNIKGYNYAAHFIYYVPRNCDKTWLSSSITSFKDGRDRQNEGVFAKWVVADLNKQGIVVDYIVRALGSSELIAGPDTALNRVCCIIATSTGARSIVSNLTKIKQASPMHLAGNAQNRFTNINGKYQFSPPESEFEGTILVIDDVVTTKNTVMEIERAIRASCPDCNLVFFALAQTENNPSCNEQFVERENS